MVKPALLLILDGFGERSAAEDNAITRASMPNYKAARAAGVTGRVLTSGEDVGLPPGQMGNSEVGHLNIGAGRIIKQTLVRIDEAIAADEMIERPELRALASRLDPKRTLHLIGLVSEGGIHSSMSHLKAALGCAHRLGLRKIAFHLLTDGRDTAPDSALRFVSELQESLPKGAFFASLGGRYFAMDRDQRWERVQRAWAVIVDGEGASAESAQQAIHDAYERGETDEFIEPTVLTKAPMEDGDAVWFLNFRADRVRQFAAALTLENEPGCFARRLPLLSSVLGMVPYRSDLELESLFEPPLPKQTLGEIIADQGLAQLRIAETEKYAHVTYFFNGGIEQGFDGEERILIPSPRDVPTYDKKPEMSAPEVSRRLIEAISSEIFSLIVCNFANPDMVGHSGNLRASILAMEALDGCLGKVLGAAKTHGYGVMISADHGNIEQMRSADGKPHTQHTTGPVPVVLLGMDAAAVDNGLLSDLAPTLLDYMGVDKPVEMSGRSLLVRP
jgi:2,3-bisphosphoglycerate-independent phosphoglycerate mutase